MCVCVRVLQCKSQHAARGPGQRARPRAQHDTASRSVLWVPQLPISLTERERERQKERERESVCVCVCSCRQGRMIPDFCVFYLLQTNVSQISTHFFECALVFSSAISQALTSKITVSSTNLLSPALFFSYFHTDTTIELIHESFYTLSISNSEQAYLSLSRKRHRRWMWRSQQQQKRLYLEQVGEEQEKNHSAQHRLKWRVSHRKFIATCHDNFYMDIFSIYKTQELVEYQYNYLLEVKHSFFKSD